MHIFPITSVPISPRSWKKTPLAARILNRVLFSNDPDECWPWMGDHARGYGVVAVSLNGRRQKRTVVTRLIYEMFTGHPVPRKLNVCHSCDNPPCCNPKHLFIGTTADNVHDKWQKGRAATVFVSGEKHRIAKLSNAQVAECRELLKAGRMPRELAVRYGVSPRYIRHLRAGTWRKLG